MVDSCPAHLYCWWWRTKQGKSLPTTDQKLFMRLYTGNRRGANERRGFFLSQNYAAVCRICSITVQSCAAVCGICTTPAQSLRSSFSKQWIHWAITAVLLSFPTLQVTSTFVSPKIATRWWKKKGPKGFNLWLTTDKHDGSANERCFFLPIIFL